MKKGIFKFFIILLALLFPMGVFFLYVEKMEDQYGETYLAALQDKYLALEKAEKKKIVFVGGSSLPFGLRSELIEEELDGEYEVINFGLYATLGTKFMMDIVDDFVEEGDIIVLSPELATQTYSLYFNPDAVLEACDGYAYMLNCLPAGDGLKLFYNYFKFATKKIGYYRDGNPPDPIGIYRRDSFNGYGDIEVYRHDNVMGGGYDINTKITFTDELLDEEFLAYVNKFRKKIDRKGGTLFFNYSPVNVLAVGSSRAQGNKFHQKLDDALDCEILGSIEGAMIDERYFYDTNYHLNSSGALYYTDMLVKNLKSAIGMEAESSIEVPAPPDLAADGELLLPDSDEKVPFTRYDGGANANYADYFEYRLVGSAYQIIGVKEEYRDMEEVILPTAYEGKAVTTVRAGAFEGCASLKRIRIGKSYRTIEGGAFAGCSALTGIYFYELNGNVISVPFEGLLDGCNAGVKLYILPDAEYMTGYTWTNYAEYFDVFSIEE